MKFIIVKGNKDVGKTTTIKKAFIKLVKKYSISDADIKYFTRSDNSIAEIKERLNLEARIGKGWIKNIKLIVSLKGKNILFYSAGDKQTDYLKIKEIIKSRKIDIVVCAWRTPGTRFILEEYFKGKGSKAPEYVHVLGNTPDRREDYSQDVLEKIEKCL